MDQKPAVETVAGRHIFLQERNLKLLFGEQRCFPKPHTKMPADFTVEEREGDENEDQQPGSRVNPQGTLGT